MPVVHGGMIDVVNKFINNHERESEKLLKLSFHFLPPPYHQLANAKNILSHPNLQFSRITPGKYHDIGGHHSQPDDERCIQEGI